MSRLMESILATRGLSPRSSAPIVRESTLLKIRLVLISELACAPGDRDRPPRPLELGMRTGHVAQGVELIRK